MISIAQVSLAISFGGLLLLAYFAQTLRSFRKVTAEYPTLEKLRLPGSTKARLGASGVLAFVSAPVMLYAAIEAARGTQLGFLLPAIYGLLLLLGGRQLARVVERLQESTGDRLLRLAGSPLTVRRASALAVRAMLPSDAIRTSRRFASDAPAYIDDRIRELDSTFREAFMQALTQTDFFAMLTRAMTDPKFRIAADEPSVGCETEFVLMTRDAAKLCALDFYWFARNILCAEILAHPNATSFREDDVAYLVERALQRSGVQPSVRTVLSSGTRLPVSFAFLEAINNEMAESDWRLEFLALSSFVKEREVFVPTSLTVHLRPKSDDSRNDRRGLRSVALS